MFKLLVHYEHTIYSQNGSASSSSMVAIDFPTPELAEAARSSLREHDGMRAYVFDATPPPAPRDRTRVLEELSDLFDELVAGREDEDSMVQRFQSVLLRLDALT